MTHTIPLRLQKLRPSEPFSGPKLDFTSWKLPTPFEPVRYEDKLLNQGELDRRRHVDEPSRCSEVVQ